MHRVLIVDDEPLVRQHLRMLIDWEAAGFSVVAEAEDGREAFAAFERLHPDILITDIRMPEMSGLDLIRSIRTAGYAAGFVVLSGYDDFAYTQQAMRQGVQNYLLKPVTKTELLGALQSAALELQKSRTLQHQLAKGIIACRERWLLNILGAGNLEECAQAASSYGIELSGREMTLFVAECEYPEGDDEESMDADLLTALHSKDVVVAPIGRAVVCLRLHSKEEESRTYALRLKETLEASGARVQIACGARAKTLKDVRAGYQQARKLLESRWLLGSGDILESIPGQEEYDEQSAWEALKRWNRQALDDAICRRDDHAIRVEVADFFRVLDSIRSNPQLVRYIFVEDVLRSMRMLIEQGGDAYAVAGESFNIDELLRQKSFDKLREWYAELCVSISGSLAHLKACQTKSIAQQMIALIRKEPQKAYTLQELAKIFYMNPAYLGQLFKKETGQTLHAYTAMYRVGQSRQDLLDTSDPVYDIAERNGFQSLRHFYMAFKKIEGCTPSEYRERMRHI